MRARSVATIVVVSLLAATEASAHGAVPPAPSTPPQAGPPPGPLPPAPAPAWQPLPLSSQLPPARPPAQPPAPRANIHLELPLYDAPFNTLGGYSAPSMRQSLALSEDLYGLAPRGYSWKATPRPRAGFPATSPSTRPCRRAPASKRSSSSVVLSARKEGQGFSVSLGKYGRSRRCRPRRKPPKSPRTSLRQGRSPRP